MNSENKHYETDVVEYPHLEDTPANNPSKQERGLGSRIFRLLGAGASALSLGLGVAHTIEGSTPTTQTATEKPHFEYVQTDLSHDVQDALINIQVNYPGYGHDKTLAPDVVPDITLNQVGEQSFVIVDGAGGLAEQAEHAYLTEHGGDAAPQSVQDSITVTTKALTQINHIEQKSDNIQPNDNFVLIELKDAEGTDLVVVSPDAVSTD